MTGLQHIRSDSPAFPQRLHTSPLISEAPTVTALGNLALLQASPLALFCSQRCPGRLVNATYELAQRLRDAGRCVIGGFHSPMERECLNQLLRGAQPIIMCPARSIASLRVPGEWRTGLESGRILIISPFDDGDRRVTAGLAVRRNRFVATLADEVFIAYAAPGSATERFAQDVSAAGTPLLTLNAPENAPLVAQGARIVQTEDFPPLELQGQLPLFR